MIFAAVRYPKQHGYESPLAQHFYEKAKAAKRKRDEKTEDYFLELADRAEREYQDAVNIRII